MEGEPDPVGMDVSTAQVDVAVRPTGQRWVVSYDETGIKELVSQMVDLGPAMVLPTGGLELSWWPLSLRPRCRWWWSTRAGATSPGPPVPSPRPALDAAVCPLRRRHPPEVALSETRRARSSTRCCPQAPGVAMLAPRRHRLGTQRGPSPHRSPYRLVGTGVERLGRRRQSLRRSPPLTTFCARSRRGGAALSHAGRPRPSWALWTDGRSRPWWAWRHQPGQRHLARPTRRLGRTLPGSGRSLHGDADRDPFQSRHQRLLPEAAGGRGRRK